MLYSLLKMEVPRNFACRDLNTVILLATYLNRVRDLELLDGVHGNHPGADGGGKVLGQERAQRHVLPLLDVARCRGVGEMGDLSTGKRAIYVW